MICVQKYLVSCSECLLSVDKGMNSVNHVLHKLLLRSSESPSIRDIKDSIICLGMLTVDTTDLDEVLISDAVELIFVVHELRQLDMYRSSKGSTKISRARSDVTEMIVLGEFALLLNGLSSSTESIEDFFDSSSLLHRNNSELILLIDPDEESLGLVMEDTTTRGPVSVEITSFKEPVSFFEKEVVINELLLISCTHTFKRVEFTLEIGIKFGGGSCNNFHDLESLLLGDTWTKREISEVSSDTDTSGIDHGSLIFGEISICKTLRGHICNVLVIYSMSVIILDDSIKEFVEFGVGRVRTCVKANT